MQTNLCCPFTTGGSHKKIIFNLRSVGGRVLRSVGDIEKNPLRSVDDKPRVCVRDVRHLLWYTKRWCHKMITRRYYKLFMLNKFAASSTLNNCLAKSNIYSSFFKQALHFGSE